MDGKVTKSKRITRVEHKALYCRKCTDTKTEADFYKASDDFLDTNGYLSICKECCEKIYDKYYNIEHDIDKAILRTCRVLNIAYLGSALQSVHSTLAEREDKFKNVFGIYKRSIGNLIRMNPTLIMTFEEPARISENIEELESSDENFDVQEFWGQGWDYDEYIYLEKELADWKRSAKCENKTQLTLLKEIALKQLEIRKLREEGKSTDNALKVLQDLMRTCAIDPAKANLIAQGKNLDAYGVWIKDIEHKRPAEWLAEQGNVFKDVDDMKKYSKDFIERPIKNFLTGSRDFNLTEDGEIDDGSIDDLDNLTDEE